MKKCRATLKSASPLCWTRAHTTPKLEKEGVDAYEQRTWREKWHTNPPDDPEGRLFIPPTALRNVVTVTAKFLAKQIPGKGKSTYTKHFEAGLLCGEGITLPYTKEDLQPLPLFVPADGIAGSPKRVWKTFPIIFEWEGSVDYMIIDETITKDVFLEHLMAAGEFIGLGSLRVRNRGYFGRFTVEQLLWDDEIVKKEKTKIQLKAKRY